MVLLPSKMADDLHAADDPGIGNDPGNWKLHGDDRSESDLALFDALVGFGDLVETVRFGHDANFAARGDRQRLVQVVAAVLLAADDLDPLPQEFERRNHE